MFVFLCRPDYKKCDCQGCQGKTGLLCCHRAHKLPVQQRASEAGEEGCNSVTLGIHLSECGWCPL